MSSDAPAFASLVLRWTRNRYGNADSRAFSAVSPAALWYRGVEALRTLREVDERPLVLQCLHATPLARGGAVVTWHTLPYDWARDLWLCEEALSARKDAIWEEACKAVSLEGSLSRNEAKG